MTDADKDHETVERVGRALAAADAKNGRDPEVHYSDYRDNWNRMARAALSAMPPFALILEALTLVTDEFESALRAVGIPDGISATHKARALIKKATGT